ncbi:MAG TPA: hypothetical protein VM925_24905 [Labilithrix sp.]|jgi:hypothetical protein|nr:hypothetical protein [Labilithrix sp.]
MGRPPWVEDERSLRHKSTHGEVAVWFPAPLVIVYKYKGFADASHARFIERTFDEAFGPDQRHIHLFVDTEGQTGYDAEFRRATGARASRIQDRTDTYCLLVRSRIIALGIHVAAFAMGAPRANGLTGRISAIADREVFRARLEAAVRRSLELAAR